MITLSISISIIVLLYILFNASSIALLAIPYITGVVAFLFAVLISKIKGSKDPRDELKKKLLEFIKNAERIITIPFTFVKNLFLNGFSFITKLFQSVIGIFNTVVKFINERIIGSIINFIKTIILNPIIAIGDYIKNLTDWFTNKATNYVLSIITFIFQFVFFQFQELLNSFIKSAFGIFKLPAIKVIKLDKKFFIF